ncbi:M14 family zinc carboxypeptidase [Metabacillus fastidiosus]|uniref:M14 family zinc carboxypeptidase n=1 Tax=Metabacillus fastidiosus TaxID=1458 RepID=UPI002DBAA2EE|nr:M14 family zinc carboxypeptidase [Metabacillus fastidiosus]MEC2077854.1 M14 family zinc carboxypeptidase [Metabacillus fastidiosus]
MQKSILSAFFFLCICMLLSFSPEQASAASYINTKQVYTYEIMEQDIEELAKAYPDLIQYKVIGKSEYGRNIYAVSLGKGSSVSFINGSHHAREWMTTIVNMYMIDQYANAYKNGTSINGYNVRSILNDSTIWFLPMVNPDGVTLQQFGLKKFPKEDHDDLIKMNAGSTNFSRWKANAKGLDLNRQYDADWKNICCNPGKPYFKNYKGPKPHHAKEVTAVLDFVNEIKPEISVSYHSSGQILYWNFHQKGTQYNRDHALAKQIGRMTGYSLVYPKSNPSGGGFTDWFISHYNRPAFTPEIAPYVQETSPLLSVFPKVWNENKAVGLYVTKEGHKLFMGRYQSVQSAATKKVNNALLKSKALRPYHTTNIKTVSDLNISADFTNLFNDTGKLIKEAEQSLVNLTEADKTRLSIYIEEAKARRTDAARFIDAVNIGDKLLEQKAVFNRLLLQGKLDDTIVMNYNELSSSINKAEKVVSRIYGSEYRKLAGEKYISPSKISRESIIYEVSRYNLLGVIEDELEQQQYSQVKERFAMLERLEERSIQIKADGNKKYPGKYPDYPEIEAQLQIWKQSLAEKYKGVTNSELSNNVE